MDRREYSPIKDFSRKRPHFLFRIARAFFRAFFPKTEWIFRGEKPKEGPVVFVCNHTKLYAPAYFAAVYKGNVRVWENNYFLYVKRCWNHIKNKVFADGNLPKILKPVAFLLTPLIVLVSRAVKPVPVYHKCKEVVSMTFKKSVETAKEGIFQVIFAERTVNRVNRYLYQLNAGFPKVAEVMYRETGQKMIFYPVYCAPLLRKIVVGNPVVYDPEKEMETQRYEICAYLEREIEKNGDFLPPHEPVLYV